MGLRTLNVACKEGPRMHRYLVLPQLTWENQRGKKAHSYYLTCFAFCSLLTMPYAVQGEGWN